MTAVGDADNDRLVTLALDRLSGRELAWIHLLLFYESELPPEGLRGSLAARSLALRATRLARACRETIDPRAGLQAARAITDLRRRVAQRHAERSPGDSDDLSWLVRAWATRLGRGIHPRELQPLVESLRAGALDRDAIRRTLEQTAIDERQRLESPNEIRGCWLMGTSRHISHEDWRRRGLDIDARGRLPDDTPAVRPLVTPRLAGPPRCRVSILASLYRGGAFIETFLANLCGQTIFREWCELIIVDAASPDGEGEAIRRWMRDHPNIRYIRAGERIGIYEAWNLAIERAQGEFLTNANVDDLRREDSLEVQALALQALPEADVVCQDVYYSLEPCRSFERIRAFGFRSALPRITPAVLLDFNPPHNAPMWRRRLHRELGAFDCRYRSAADYEFWLRCMAAGKLFHRVADPHVAYYQNPLGLSTGPDSSGQTETREITARYALRLLAGLEPIDAPAQSMARALTG